ncbi:hypothetical protein C8J56DRAFT_832326 [Mycena floridula]|nr:hypothetical protein C8J56DRAFT_832326 [Mycena floridula]
MDVAASIIALMQGAQALFNYVVDVREGFHARAELLESLGPLPSLLNTLVVKVQPPCQNTELVSTANLLCSPEGPFTQLQALMDRLHTKLGRSSASSTSRTQKVLQALKWSIDKGEVAELMQKIERVKSLITLALQNDLVTLNHMIRDDIREAKTVISKGVDDLSADISGIGNEVRNMSDKLTPMVERVQSHIMSDDMRKFVDWLSCLDFQTTQQHLISQWTPGTVDWFIENAKFQDWTAGKFGVLWCPGEPGVGKTILASRVIDHLQKDCLRPDVGVAYIFFCYNEANTQDIRALVVSILRQLLIGNTIADWLVPLYNSFQAGHPLGQDINTLVNALDSQIHDYSDVYLVVDAFDECSEDIREDFLSRLCPLTDSNRLHILVTSRLLLSIESQFKDDQRINVRTHDDDVRVHILDQRLCRQGDLHCDWLDLDCRVGCE